MEMALTQRYCDLEFSLRHHDHTSFALEARYRTDSDHDRHLISPAVLVSIQEAELLSVSLAPEEYGKALTRQFFADPRVSLAFDIARTDARRIGVPLRVRLRLDPSSPWLHSLQWETLCDPRQDHALSMAEDILLSRYLDSDDSTAHAARALDEITALIVVASPKDLASYQLEQLRIEDEVTHLQSALRGIRTHILARTNRSSPPTLNNLAAKLRENPDLVYFVGHGARIEDETYVWLENEDGSSAPTLSSVIVSQIRQLPFRPRLMFLASCLSASTVVRGSELTALGLQIAQAGVPAVIAMQGLLSVAGAHRLVKAFFDELRRDGMIDRALAAARSALRTTADWPLPVLLLRARTGQLWRTSAFALPPLTHPPLPTVLVGRTQELVRARTRLQHEGVIGLTGIAGVGKSALAARLATDSADTRLPFWYTFRSNEPWSDILRQFAAYFARQGRDQLWRIFEEAKYSGTMQYTSQDLIGYLPSLCEHTGAILCLEDLHVAERDAFVGQILNTLVALARQGHVKLIVTSRHQQLPVIQAPLLLEGLDVESVQALVAQSGIIVEPRDLEILQRGVEGNPALLLLIVGALQQAQNSTSLLANINRNNSFAEYMFQHIVDLLSEESVRLLQAMAVLDRDASPAMLEHVSELPAVPVLLDQLEARFLIVRVANDADLLFRLHPLVQQYYRVRLSTVASKAFHRRAAEWYRAEREPFLSVHHLRQCGDFDAAAALVEATSDWLISRGQAVDLLRLVRFLEKESATSLHEATLSLIVGETCLFLGELTEAEIAFQLSASLLEILPPLPEIQVLHMRVCRGMSRRLETEDIPAAKAWLQRGRELLPGCPPIEAARLNHRLGSVLIAEGAFEEAQAVLEGSLREVPIDADNLRADILVNLGSAFCSKGELERGKRMFQLALHAYRRCQDRRGVAAVQQNIGYLEDLAGNWQQADAEYAEALEIAYAIGNVERQAELLLNRGVLAINRGLDEQAITYLQACLAMAGQDSMREQVILAEASLADLRLRQGDDAQAQAHLERAMIGVARLQETSARAELARGFAVLSLLRREEEAVSRAEEAVAIASETGDPREEGVCLRILGQGLYTVGRHAEGLAAFQASAKLLEGKEQYEFARTLLAWGQEALSVGEAAEATILLQRAQTIFATLGATRDERVVVLALTTLRSV